MPQLPWTSGSALASDNSVVLVSYLPLAKKSATLLFVRKAAAVRGQLKAAEGLIGYSLDAQLFSGRYWTLSWWRSQADMDRFVAAEPHRSSMSQLAGVIGATAFHSWTAAKADGPPSWQDARQRLAAASS